jgi:hypothetical protein
MKSCYGILLCVFMAASGHFFCTTVNVAGGSSSTDNGKVVGKVCREDGLPAPNTQVTLRPADFDPCRDTGAPDIDTTDSAGTYEFDGLASGVYTLEAVSIDDRTRALVNPVMVDSAATHSSVASLAEPGALKVQVQNSSAAPCYVYVPGTSLYGEVRDGVGFIDSVPAGFIPAVYFADLTDPAIIHIVKTGITLGAGATCVIADYSMWKYSARVLLNTTQSGAGVSGNVYHFPVLIRLSDANFDFGQALPDGGDLRFRKPDDTPLPYEFERWDAAGRKAEIWVLTDTVYGNDSARFFTMYWGNSAAVSESNGAAVFDTAKGFQGVWHLAEEGDAVAGDATVNHYNGTPYNMTTASAVSGAIGTARDFDGGSSYISMLATANSKLNFPQNGSYSMSLWAYADTIDTLWHAIAGKGHEQYYMQFKCFGENRATWEFVEFEDRLGWEYTEDSTPPAPSSRTWVFITGVRSGSSQRLYINGEEVVDTAALMSGDYPRASGDNFTIGRYGRSVTIPYRQGWSYFNGKVDEVRVSGVALSADWIRLSYMNQKADDALAALRR